MKYFGPLGKVLVLGQGALVKRQRPTYEHWLAQGVEVHCADTDPGRLKNLLPGIHPYLLPRDEGAMLARAPFDLLYVANTPALHLKSVLQYGTHARKIIIQKPLHSGLVTAATAEKLGVLRYKIAVHDHYRNKGAFAALISQGYQKRVRRLLFFLTEAKSITSEMDRVGTLACGVLLDLGVHMFSLLLDCIRTLDFGLRAPSPSGWKNESEECGRNLASGVDWVEFPPIELLNCCGAQELGSNLGIGVETLAVLDLTIKGTNPTAAEPPSQSTKMSARPGEGTAKGGGSPPLDVLIAVGKGLGGRSQGDDGQYTPPGDLKSVVIEFADGETAVADLTSQGVSGLAPAEVNIQHGGLNRPLLLISPNPPAHAQYGLGGMGYPQWQSFSEAARACEIAHRAREQLPPNLYPYKAGIVLEDFLAQLLQQGELRPIWRDIGDPQRFKIPPPRTGLLYD